MQYAVNSPTEYMSALDDDWRKETLGELRTIILELAPELEESIRYGMLNYGTSQGGLFALNAQKHYVSFYVGDADNVDPDGTLLAGLSRGKGCIRFSKTRSVNETGIREFISRAVALHRQGSAPDC